MKTIKKILNWIMLILTGKGPIADKAADDDICNFSGQGRDKHGR